MYICFKKTWAKTFFLHLNQIITILKKQVVNQAVKREKKNSEIVAIFNRYIDILDDFINSLDLESLSKLIDKKSCNVFRFKSNSTDFLKKYYLDEDILDSNMSS